MPQKGDKMSIKIYTLRDSKSEVYNLPIFQKTHGEAERFLKSIISEDPKQLPGYYANVSKYPEDFDLYFLGDYDESTGKCKLLDTPQHMVKAVNLKSLSLAESN